MTGEEIWIHHTDLERNYGEWSGMTQYFPEKKEENNALSSKDHANCPLRYWRLHFGQVSATTENHQRCGKRPGKETILQHDMAQPHRRTSGKFFTNRPTIQT
jgi:hypothetical protein